MIYHIWTRMRTVTQSVSIYKPTRDPVSHVAVYQVILAYLFSHLCTIGQRRFHVTLVFHHVSAATVFFSTSLCTDLRTSRNYTHVLTCTTDATLEICVCVARSGTSARKPGRCLIRWQYFIKNIIIIIIIIIITIIISYSEQIYC